MAGKIKYTEEEVLKQLQDHFKRNGKITSKTFEKDKTVCSVTTEKEKFGSWEKAFKKSGIEKDRRVIYSDEEILNQIKLHYQKNPNMNSYTFKADKSTCTASTVTLRFGSWEKALKEAGIELKKELTKEEIGQQLKDFYNKNGTINTRSFGKEKEYCSIKTVKKAFGSWNNALIELGLMKSKGYIEYNKEELLEVLKEKVKLGELRYRTDIEKLEGVPSWTYVKKLWTWDELVQILKLKRVVYAYTDGEIIGAYRRLKKKKYRNKKISSDTMGKETGIRVETIGKHFGSWNKFLKLMNETEIYNTSKVVHTKEELLDMYKKYSLKLVKEEYGASRKDLGDSDFPYSVEVLLVRFGSMNNLRRLAGFKEVSPGKSIYTKAGLKEMLYKKYVEKERKLTQRELKEDKDMPTLGTFLRYFQTTKMSEVWAEVLENKELWDE